MIPKISRPHFLGFFFGSAAIVLILGCGIAADWRLPLDRTDPRYEFNAETGTYTFLTQHEPATVYRILLAIVEEPPNSSDVNQWREQGKRKIIERNDVELRMVVSYPPARDWYFQIYPGDKMTIICRPAAKGTRLAVKFRSGVAVIRHLGRFLFEPLTHQLETKLRS